MKPKPQLLRALCARWGVPIPEMAINEAIRAAFPDLQDLAPPIQLGPLVASRKVTDVQKTRLSCDGIISRVPHGLYLIQVNRDHPEVRRRFTIAHELGHTFFFDVDPRIRQRVRDTGLDQAAGLDSEEVLCNYAAAEILMPHRQFGTAVRKTGPSASAIRTLARGFNVSLHAAARRLIQIAPFNLAAAQWTYREDARAYATDWAAGLNLNRPAVQRELVIRHNHPAFKVLHEANTYRGRVWVPLNGPMDDYFTDLEGWHAKGKRKVLTVFVLDPEPERVFLHSRPAPLRETEQLKLF